MGKTCVLWYNRNGFLIRGPHFKAKGVWKYVRQCGAPAQNRVFHDGEPIWVCNEHMDKWEGCFR